MILRRLPHVDEGADELFGPGLGEDLLRQDPDEEDLHPADLHDAAGGEEARPVGGDVQIGAEDREAGAFFEKEQVGDAVVRLVVPHAHRVRREHVDDLHGGNAPVLRVDDGSAEHVPRDDVQGVGILLRRPGDVPGEQGHPAHRDPVDLFGKKIPVQVVGVKQGQAFDAFVRHESSFWMSVVSGKGQMRSQELGVNGGLSVSG